ncbi:LCP family protein [Faecalibaculum rodentium]|jgi:LCP family protein required for cell wall assembly|uniref:LCP family protein n=1 Tax=Faecalibaculum rodentium TaxID=1702221 RepID=UPI0025712ABC|nr:LCP family protein [Faecalibaculum rodentium]
MKPLWKRPGLYISIVTGILTALFIYELYKLSLLPAAILAGIIITVLLMWILSAICLIKEDLHLTWRIVGGLLALCLALASAGGMYYANTGNKALEELSDQEGKSIVAVYVLNNHVIEDARDLEGRKIGVLKTMSAQGTDVCLEELKKAGVNITTEEFDSSYRMTQALKGQAIDGMILDQGYLDTLLEMPGMENLDEEIVPVVQYYYDAPKTNTAETVDTAMEPFTVYISGIDTRENKLLRNSRSDVNLLATVNPESHEILLVSIPRDYYVETVCEPDMGCMNGAMDKLTHTGLHGPETTEMTLEKLFDTSINYNVRVNFSSLVNVVDELGGVQLFNPEAFTSVSGPTFQQGDITLNGQQALAFVRERYAFTDGDRARGRNQMRVLTAIINKMMSPKILTNFTGIMNSLSSSFETNMSEKDIKALVQAQLADPAKWTIYSYSVTGSGGTDYAAELGDNAYVMYPDQATVDNAKADIKAVLSGEPAPFVNPQ